MTRLFALLAKDARLLMRNRALLVALLLYPLLLGTVLGAAFREPPTRLDLVVVNQDAGGAALDVGGDKLTSEDLVQASSAYADVTVVGTEAQALAKLRAGDADAALVIPLGFMADLGRLGSNATLRVIVDESDAVRAGVARSAVAGGVDDFVRAVVARKIQDVETLLNLTVHGGTTRVAFVDIDVLGIERARTNLTEVLNGLDPNGPEAAKVRNVITFLDFATGVLGNSELYLTTTAMPLHVETSGLASAQTSLVAVALPGALVLGVFWTGSLAAALLFARERETGVARRLAAAPGARLLVPLSKLVVAFVAALVPAAILVLIGVGGLGAIARQPVLAFDALVLASLAAAALGALAAGLARATSGAALLAVLMLTPMLLLGGLFYPIAYMPQAAQVVSGVLPITLATDALRGAMLRGSGLDELALPLGGLAVFAILAGGVGAWLARRE